MRQTVKLSFLSLASAKPVADRVVEVVAVERLPVGACVVQLPGQAPRVAHGVATGDGYVLQFETESQAASSAGCCPFGTIYGAQVCRFGFELFEVQA